MSDWDRFNDQFREDEDERNDRLHAARIKRAAAARIAARPCGLEASNTRDGDCEKCGGKWTDMQRPRECTEPPR